MSIHVDYTKSRLGGSAKWRESLAERYPDDKRLPVAARLLHDLAVADGSTVALATKLALAEYTGPDFVEAVNATSREVGFRFLPMTLDAFLQAVLVKLAAQEAPSPAGASLAHVAPTAQAAR